jgi:hypothetical protein
MFSQKFKWNQELNNQPIVFGEPVIGKRIVVTEAVLAGIAPLVMAGKSTPPQVEQVMQFDALIYSVVNGLVTRIEVISNSANLPRILDLDNLESYFISESLN